MIYNINNKGEFLYMLFLYKEWYLVLFLKN